MKIKDLPTAERPAARLRSLGADSLSTAELLSLFLEAPELEPCAELVKLATNAGGFGRMNRADIKTVKGFSEGSADKIAVLVEFARREARMSFGERPTVSHPDNVYDLIGYEMSRLDHEELRVILLDTRNNVIDTVRVYKGTLNSASVRVGELFKAAIAKNAASIILVHNHPSGDPTPSPEDTLLTRNVVTAGQTMDIQVVDHIIIGDGRYKSLKALGVGGF